MEHVAKILYEQDMFPLYDACHYIMMSMAVREDAPQSGALVFSRVQPMLCWVATIVMCYAGNILASSLLGDSLLVPLEDNKGLVLATICWFLVNFSYNDVVYHLCSFLPVRLAICLTKELQRTYKIYSGVNAAAKRYPGDYMIWLIVGMVKGAGSYHMRSIITIVINAQNFQIAGMTKWPTASKACLLVAMLFTLKFAIFGIDAPIANLYLICTIFLMYFRLAVILFHLRDPFIPLENVLCGLIFGDPQETLQHFIRVRSTFIYGDERKMSDQSRSIK